MCSCILGTGIWLPVPFSLISQFLRKILEEKIDTCIANSTLVCATSKNVCSATIFAAQLKHLLRNSHGTNHPLIETILLRLAVWNVSGKVFKWNELQAMLASLSHIQGEKAQQLIINYLAVSGPAGV